MSDLMDLALCFGGFVWWSHLGNRYLTSKSERSDE